MALSEHEQEILDQIELGLYTGAAKSTDRPLAAETRSGLLRRRMLIVLVAIVVGLALVLAGLISNVIVISVIGFLLIVTATMAAGRDPVQLWARLATAPSETGQRAKKLGRPVDEV